MNERIVVVWLFQNSNFGLSDDLQSKLLGTSRDLQNKQTSRDLQNKLLETSRDTFLCLAILLSISKFHSNL